jgi:hypothetical protein
MLGLALAKRLMRNDESKDSGLNPQAPRRLMQAEMQVQNTRFNVRETLARADEMMAHLRRQISSRKENGP